MRKLFGLRQFNRVSGSQKPLMKVTFAIKKTLKGDFWSRRLRTQNLRPRCPQWPRRGADPSSLWGSSPPQPTRARSTQATWSSRSASRPSRLTTHSEFRSVEVPRTRPSSLAPSLASRSWGSPKKEFLEGRLESKDCRDERKMLEVKKVGSICFRKKVVLRKTSESFNRELSTELCWPSFIDRRGEEQITQQDWEMKVLAAAVVGSQEMRISETESETESVSERKRGRKGEREKQREWEFVRESLRKD